jgi:hypothetical protein
MKAVVGVVAVLGVVAMLGAAIFVLNSQPGEQITAAANIRATPFYRVAADTISLDPELTERLGTPMTFGETVLKQYDVKNDLGSAQLDIMVKGPKLAGHVLCKVTHQSERQPWNFRGGDFFPSEGPPTHLAPKN